MKRLFLLFTVLIGLVLLLSIGVAAEERPVTFYLGGTQVGTATTQSDGTLTLPGGPTMGARQFIGWVLKADDGTESLHAAGSVYTAAPGTAALRFEAFGIELRTLRGAAVNTAAPYTLRFDGVLGADDHTRLLALLGKENVSFGMLIAPYNGPSAFDHTSCPTGTVDRVATGFAYTTEKYGVFTGTSEALGDDALLDRYCGRAYLTVKIGNVTKTLYAPYNLADHMRNVHGVSAAAFDDRSATATAFYNNATDLGHSPYTTAQLDHLRSRLDKIVFIYVDLTGSGSDASCVQAKYSMDHFTFFDFENTHYTSPYTLRGTPLINDPVGYNTYVVIAKEGADIQNVQAYYIGGSYRTPNRAQEWREDGIYVSIPHASAP